MAVKLSLDVDEETWKEVKKYKIDKDLKNNNEAVVELIKEGLKLKNRGSK